MAKNFTNWKFAFVKLQKVFSLEVVEIPDALSEMLIREEDISSTQSSSSGKTKSSANTSLNESLNSSESELEDLNCTIIETNNLISKISDEITAINSNNTPEKLPNNEKN